jgi:hypothetical protein
MGGPFDRSPLKTQLLRRRVVVNGCVGVVDLGVEHLMRPAPRANKGIRGFRDDGLKARMGFLATQCSTTTYTAASIIQSLTAAVCMVLKTCRDKSRRR